MENTKEKEMLDALTYAGCPKLPRAINVVKDQSRIWIRAIARVRKVTGAETYVILKNDYGRKPVVIKTFGESSAIAKIDSIHPFEWLEREFIPTFKREGDKEAFLAKVYSRPVEKISALSDGDKDRLLYIHLFAAQSEYNRNKSI